MWEFLGKEIKDLDVLILSVKRLTKLNDTYFRIKIFGQSKEINDVRQLLINKLPNASVSYHSFSRRNHKYTFSTLRPKFIDLNSNRQNSTTSNNAASSSNSHNDMIFRQISPTLLINSTLHRTFRQLSITLSNQQYTFTQNSFSFCLSWNTNGWNFDKRDNIEFFICVYKPLFICFQETGNGSGSKSNYPCRVKIKNYKYFFKKADDSIPGKRGLFLDYHKAKSFYFCLFYFKRS